MASWTYKTDQGLYDVLKLSDEAQISFQYLAEVEAEVQTLSKRVDVLRAAAQTFHGTIQASLVDEAIIKEEDAEEAELVEEE